MRFSDACWNAVRGEFAVMLGEIIAAVTERVAQAKPAVRGDTAWVALLERSLAPVPRCEDGKLSFGVKLEPGPDWGEYLPFGEGGPPVFEGLLEAAVEGLAYEVFLKVTVVQDLVATPREHAAALDSKINDSLNAPGMREALPAVALSALAAASVALVGLTSRRTDICADNTAPGPEGTCC